MFCQSSVINDKTLNIGGSLHISQGLEVVEWSTRRGELLLQIERPGIAEGELLIKLPEDPEIILLKEKRISFQKGGIKDAHSVPVRFSGKAQIRLTPK